MPFPNDPITDSGLSANHNDSLSSNVVHDHNNFPIYVRGRHGLVARNAMDSETESLLPSINSLNENKSRPCCDCYRYITVEPWLFLVVVASLMQNTVVKNVILEKLCLQSNFNTSDCMNTTNATLEEYLQVRTSTIEMYTSITETLPSVIAAIFLGSYGDRRGRKLPMVIPVIGALFSSVVGAVFCHFMAEIPVEYMPLVIIPRALTGGLIATIMAALSYVAQLSDIQSRTQHVAAVEVTVMLGMPLATLAAGYIYHYSYTLVYVIAVALYLMALIYIAVFIREPSHPDMRIHVGFDADDLGVTTVDDKKCFSFSGYKDTFYTFFKARGGYTRCYILLLSAVLCFNFFLLIGQLSNIYLYLRLKFNWDLTTFTYFGALLSMSMSIGLFLSTIFGIRLFKLDDMTLAPFGILASMAVNLMFAFVTKAKFLYLLCIPQLFGGVASLTVRSQISKLVDKSEQGKIFSVLGSIEGLLPVLASITYTQVYNLTVSTYPATVFVMSAAIFTIPLFIVLFVGVHMLRMENYLPMQN